MYLQKIQALRQKNMTKFMLRKKADYEVFKEDTKVKIDKKKNNLNRHSKKEKNVKIKQRWRLKQKPVGINEIKNKVQNGANNIKEAIFIKRTAN